MNAILATKVSIPQLHAEFDLARPRLLRLLDSAAHHRLIGISAFAGYGKSTLVAQWIQDKSAVWLNLDREDNDPSRLRVYLFAVVSKLRTSENVLPDNATLVLDGLECLETPIILHEFAALLQDLPPHWRIIAISRMKIPEALLFSVKNSYFEIAADDLRFTIAESNAFFHSYLRMSLPQAVTGALFRRLHMQTNGWVVGMKLAADALRRTEATITDAHLSDPLGLCTHHLDAYYEQEIFTVLPSTLRRFLIQTAMLDSLSDPALCNAVTGRSDSVIQIDLLNKHHLGEPLFRWRLRSQHSTESMDFAAALPALLPLSHFWFYSAADLDHLQQAELYLQKGQFRQSADAYAHVGAAGSDLTHLGLAELCWAWDELPAASRYLEHCLAAEDKHIRLRGYALLSQVLEANRDLHGAAVALGLAAPLGSSDSWLMARRARHWAASGQINTALQWLYSCGLSIRDEFRVQERYAYVAIVRVLLLLERFDDASVLAARLGESFLGDGFLYPAIDAFIAHSVALVGGGQTAAALAVLVKALTLAAPSRIIRPFVDGFRLNREPPIFRLLRMVATPPPQRRSELDTEIDPSYVNAILSGMERTYPLQREVSVPSPLLLESLSGRELDVLRLIAQGYSNQKIATRLLIAESTVKRHIYSIFGKLNVRNRTQAMRRADALGLLSE